MPRTSEPDLGARIVLATIGAAVPAHDAAQLLAAVADAALSVGYAGVVTEVDMVSAQPRDPLKPGPAMCPSCGRRVARYSDERFYAHRCRPDDGDGSAAPLPTWTIPLPYLPSSISVFPLLSLNDRHHPQERARRVRQLRNDMWKLTRSVRVPRCLRVRVTLHWQPATARPRDEDNPMPTLKALCDGLVDAAVVADDTHVQMEKRVQIHEPQPGEKPRMWVVVEGLEMP